MGEWVKKKKTIKSNQIKELESAFKRHIDIIKKIRKEVRADVRNLDNTERRFLNLISRIESLLIDIERGFKLDPLETMRAVDAGESIFRPNKVINALLGKEGNKNNTSMGE